jgi:hypothetical protein
VGALIVIYPRIFNALRCCYTTWKEKEHFSDLNCLNFVNENAQKALNNQRKFVIVNILK